MVQAHDLEEMGVVLRGNKFDVGRVQDLYMITEADLVELDELRSDTSAGPHTGGVKVRGSLCFFVEGVGRLTATVWGRRGHDRCCSVFFFKHLPCSSLYCSYVLLTVHTVTSIGGPSKSVHE